MSKYKLVEVDRISSLPDEIIEGILSFLPLKESMATSVLSKRWSPLWTSSIHLDFDAAKTVDCFKQLKKDLQKEKLAKYVRWVNRVVEQHTGPIIETFRVCFPNLNREHTNSIDKWVEFALEKRVQVLILDFVQLYDMPGSNNYFFPQRLLGLGGGSDLKRHVGFKYLKALLLDCVYVNEEVVEYFLYRCPSLERLSLTSLESLKQLRVVGPSIGLKYLTLSNCIGFSRIEICDTNLVSFVYFGQWVDTILKNVPCLVEISARSFLSPPTDFMNLTFSKLSCCLSQLESLGLEIDDAHYNKDYVFPKLPNLKQLELEVNPQCEWALSHLSSLMKAFPSLPRLVLKLFSHTDKEKETKEADKCPHHNLKVVEVVGYRNRTNFIKHVMYVIENAITLQRIVIDPVCWSMTHHTGAERTFKEVQEEEIARHHAMHSLKKRVPSTIEFVCL